MIVNDPSGEGKSQTSEVVGTGCDLPAAWTEAKRREAYIAVEIAATKQIAATRTLGYYIRTAMAHGLTLDEVCEAGNINPATARGLSDPDVAA